MKEIKLSLTRDTHTKKIKPLTVEYKSLDLTILILILTLFFVSFFIRFNNDGELIFSVSHSFLISNHLSHYFHSAYLSIHSHFLLLCCILWYFPYLYSHLYLCLSLCLYLSLFFSPFLPPSPDGKAMYSPFLQDILLLSHNS